mmetsp:Transcript_36464/g.65554  ORF Transcript_36464/g.65554 Transcript_36464/m.65554 type:complete len:657 (+) Transcript_36464:36-2006(+)
MSLAQRSDSKEHLPFVPADRVGLSDKISLPDMSHFWEQAVAQKAIAGPAWDAKLKFCDLQDIAERLKLKDLSEAEMRRIMEKMTGSRDGAIGYQEFRKAVNDEDNSDSVILRTLIKSLREQHTFGFKISDKYDYRKSTNDNYRADGLKFYGEFAEIRQGLDYSYHVNYTKERQEWQDHAIRTVITRTQPQTAPWLVYTCGPMGVGKGFTLAWMSKHEFFPLENIVHVDPDAFKMMMPEWPMYVEKNRNDAGTMCHRESGLMMEIAQWAAMKHSQNIWIDGSLRDADNYARQFLEVREQFPLYQISIFYVYASEATIFARVAERKEKTGRDVPEELVRQSLAAMDHSLNKLTPLSDFVARIENEGDVPVLRAFEKVDKSGCWNSIRSRFASKEEAQFPDFLPPLHLTQLPDEYVRNSIGGVDTPSSSGRENTIFLHLATCQDEISKKLLGLPLFQFEQCVKMDISPGAKLTLPSKARRLAMIPEEAKSFFFIYPLFNGTDSHPLSILNLKKHDFSNADLKSPLMELLRAGGWGYTNLEHSVIRINVISSNSEGSLLQFGQPCKMSIRLLGDIPERRFSDVSAKSIRCRGGLRYAWIPPEEEFDGNKVGGLHGCFLFQVVPNHTDCQPAGRRQDSDVLLTMQSRGERLLKFPVISTDA